jgi:hypothetical protein
MTESTEGDADSNQESRTTNSAVNGEIVDNGVRVYLGVEPQSKRLHVDYTTFKRVLWS